MNISLPDYVKKALDLLKQNGYEGYIVGGCVRDALLNKTPYDWDITTTSRPDETLIVFSSYKTIKTGLKHGTVAVIIDGKSLEITTMRCDGEYTDNRHPDSVTFTNNIYSDLSRRDFTVNAMAYNEEKGLCDPFNGESDLKNKVIKSVGNPDTRFEEDALRILRGLRFSSVLNFKIDNNTSESIIRNKSLLSNIAQERKREELLKLLCGCNVKNILIDYSEVIFEIIPEISDMYKFPQNTPYHVYDVWEHTVNTVANIKPNPIYRMAMLLHDCGKPHAFYTGADGVAHFKGHQAISRNIAETVLKRLRFSKADSDRILNLIIYHDIRPSGERVDILKTASEISPELLKDLYPVFYADASAQNPDFYKDTAAKLKSSEHYLDEAVKNNFCLSFKQLDINGNDIIEAGYCNLEIKKILSWILSEVIEEKVENSKEKLIKYIKKNYS